MLILALLNPKKTDVISKDQDTLKNSPIKIISSKHHEKSSSIKAEEYKCAKNLFRNLKNIHTYYKLLLYWIINKNEIQPEGFITNDSFWSDKFL